MIVSDRVFFAGTVAAINSIRHYHSGAKIIVVSSGAYNTPLSEVQAGMLQAAGVIVLTHDAFDRPGRVLGAWQLKAYAAADLAGDNDLIIGMDSDAVLCTDVQDVIDACLADGKLRGGKDGDGVDYDGSYEGYGFPVPARSHKYMSTSLYFAPLTELNRCILQNWAACCDKAMFGPQPIKVYPGHGDQGVLNAVIFKHCGDSNVELLDNNSFSQHWTYLSDVVTYENGQLVNRTVGRPQRVFHCGGTMKFWSSEHSQWLPIGGQNQTWNYAHWLRMLWFGETTDWAIDPAAWLDPVSHHLWKDLVRYYHQIEALAPPLVRARWDVLSDVLLTRITQDIPRAMSIGSSMNQYIQLAKTVPEHGRVVEIGSFHGGSVVTLAVALLHRNVDVTSVESFMGNCDGTVDGHQLSTPKRFYDNVKGLYPTLNIRTYHLDSVNAAARFADRSLDLAFVDGDHRTPAVVRDIEAWLPKVKPGGLLAGDDIEWDGVRAAVRHVFGDSYQSRSSVWWVQKS